MVYSQLVPKVNSYQVNSYPSYLVPTVPKSTCTHGQFVPKSCHTQGQLIPREMDSYTSTKETQRKCCNLCKVADVNQKCHIQCRENSQIQKNEKMMKKWEQNDEVYIK